MNNNKSNYDKQVQLAQTYDCQQKLMQLKESIHRLDSEIETRKEAISGMSRLVNELQARLSLPL